MNKSITKAIDANHLRTVVFEAIGLAKPIFENRLLSYEEAAQYLSVSVPYLRKLKARGVIPYVALPSSERAVRFRVRSLNEWVEKREIK